MLPCTTQIQSTGKRTRKGRKPLINTPVTDFVILVSVISKLTAEPIQGNSNTSITPIVLGVLWYFIFTEKIVNYYHETGNIHLLMSIPSFLEPNHLPTFSPATHKFTEEFQNESRRSWQSSDTYPHATYWLFFETAMHFPSKEPSSSNLCRHFLLLTSQMKTSPSSGCKMKYIRENTHTHHFVGPFC